MSYYYPYNQEDIAEDRLVELFSESIEKAYLNDGVDYSNFDLIIVFHAGIVQDFSLPFLDPTPEDIPSTFIDPEMIKSSTGEDEITIGTNAIEKGIILPETQNHLNYDISNSMFSGTSVGKQLISIWVKDCDITPPSFTPIASPIKTKGTAMVIFSDRRTRMRSTWIISSVTG